MTTTVHPSTYKSPWWYLPAGVSAPGRPVGADCYSSAVFL